MLPTFRDIRTPVLVVVGVVQWLVPVTRRWCFVVKDELREQVNLLKRPQFLLKLAD